MNGLDGWVILCVDVSGGNNIVVVDGRNRCNTILDRVRFKDLGFAT